MSTTWELPTTGAGSDMIRTRSNPNCYLCETQGELLYENLVDRLFRAPGKWNLRRCRNPECGMVWLDPLPLEEDIGKAYAKYYTHSATPMRRTWFIGLLRRLAFAFRALANPIHGERKRLFSMHLDKVKPGKLLDVGCGNGVRLAKLRALGWDVYGQDVDPVAVAYARETLGLEAHLGRLRDVPFAENSFDCVTLNHVIEHAHDPVGLLRESRRFLKPGGLLVIVTPNVSSFAHKHFGPFWRGLEPPRHIHLFSPNTLSATTAKAGFKVTRLWTTVGNAQGLAHGSLVVKNGGRSASTLKGILLNEMLSLSYLYWSMFEHFRQADSGEECVLQATH